MKKKISLSLLLVCLLTKTSFSQTHLLKEITLTNQIEKSSSIIEGKVIDKKSFWDINYQNIYTVNTIEVFKVFKGNTFTHVDIITPGGVINLDAQIVTPSLKLNIGDIGVFTLNSAKNIQLNKNTSSNHTQFEVYSSGQGFFKYNLENDQIINPFSTREGITNSFYDEIKSLTNADYTQIVDSKLLTKNTTTKTGSAKAIIVNNILPTTITAGTKSILTITGSNFGTIKGKVNFSNADDAGATFTEALDSQVLSWSDTQIKVEVPSEAGTGTIMIKKNDGTSFTPFNEITILYAQANLISDALDTGVHIAYPTQLTDKNNKGGYTWHMTSKFNVHQGSSEAFERALNVWGCETNVNWELNSSILDNNTVQQSRSEFDGYNVISFENSSSTNPADILPDNVLGKRSAYFSGCSANNGTDIRWYVDEFDIIFDDEAEFNFSEASPSLTQIDFESVAIHELGHCRQIDHTTNTNDVMHFSIQKGEELRSLNSNNTIAANLVQTRSVMFSVCGKPAMQNHSCTSLGFQEDNLNNNIVIFPNPVRDDLFIKNSTSINILSIDIFDIHSRLVHSIKPSTNSTPIKINVNNFSKGVYVLNINSNKTNITKRIVVQ